MALGTDNETSTRCRNALNPLRTFVFSDEEKSVPPTTKEIKKVSNKNKAGEKNEKVQRKRSSFSSKSQLKVLPPPRRPIRPSKIIKVYSSKNNLNLMKGIKISMIWLFLLLNLF